MAISVTDLPPKYQAQAMKQYQVQSGFYILHPARRG